MPIQTSANSFETPKKARADGLIELGKLIKTSKAQLGEPSAPRASKSSNG
jgi:hypothetical protein